MLTRRPVSNGLDPSALGPRYFPATCPAGHPPFVVKSDGGANEQVTSTCPVCRGEGRLIPGAYFSEASRARLERILGAVDSARLTPLVAQAALQRLEPVAAAPATDDVRHVLSELPGLAQLAPLLPEPRGSDDNYELRGFVGLILGMLAAYSSDGRSSRPPPGDAGGSANP